MRCPFCNADDTRVIDSRLADEGDKVRRRRECSECNERFTTYEVVELNLPRIIKSNGQRQAFNESKLRAGMERALEKRPVSAHDIDAAISSIKREVMKAGDREIPSRKLGELVVDALKGLDHVAYIRFASVYRSFEDADAFRSIIERLDKEIKK